MTPETKKYLIYGTVAVVGIGGAIFIYKKLGAGNSANAAAAADAQAQQQAQEEEAQQAQLAELGTSGVSLSAPSGGSEIPVESFSDTLSTLLQAAGLEPPASTTQPAAPVTTPAPTSPVAPVAVPTANPPHVIATTPAKTFLSASVTG